MVQGVSPFAPQKSVLFRRKRRQSQNQGADAAPLANVLYGFSPRSGFPVPE